MQILYIVKFRFQISTILSQVSTVEFVYNFVYGISFGFDFCFEYFKL